MKNFVIADILKLFFVLALAGLVAGCASNNKTYRTNSYHAPKQTAATPSPASISAKPALQSPTQSYPASPAPRGSFSSYSTSYLTGHYANYSSVRNFIQYMVQKHGFSESYLNGLFSRANRLESVIRLENPSPSYGPSKPGSWTRYRNKFLTEDHIENGAEFWRNNAATIQKASVQYGVDPEYIVGIIGVETYFGRNIGKTCIFNSLTTLAFDTHRRSKFFTSELENFLLMAREEGLDPLRPVGSWAGAMGLGQFMPSSFRRLAVDFNHDGRRDLWHEHDAIGSVAHYFSRSGWQFNSPVAARPSNSVKAASIIELSTYEGNEYWRVYPNFKVIKSYNNSNKYAMAVHQLAQAIKQRLYDSGQMARSTDKF
ncbi:MAG: lytic murein transglycosylase [Methylosarcina sp.]